MKKALYLLAFAALPVFAHAQTSDASKEADKQKLIQHFNDQAKAELQGQELPEDQKAAFKELSNCMAESIVQKYTYDEYIKLEDQLKTADPDKQKELAEKLQPLIMPCYQAMGQGSGAPEGAK